MLSRQCMAIAIDDAFNIIYLKLFCPAFELLLCNLGTSTCKPTQWASSYEHFVPYPVLGLSYLVQTLFHARRDT